MSPFTSIRCVRHLKPGITPDFTLELIDSSAPIKGRQGVMHVMPTLLSALDSASLEKLSCGPDVISMHGYTEAVTPDCTDS